MNPTTTPPKTSGPPTYIVLSGSSKPKTPTGDSTQKLSAYSVSKSSIDKENVSAEPKQTGTATKPGLKSNKNTPSQDLFNNSAAKSRLATPIVTPMAKEKASNTSKKSPFNGSERAASAERIPANSVERSAKKPHTPVIETLDNDKLSVRSKQGMESVPQTASKLGENSPRSAQPKLMTPQSTSRIYIRSAERDLGRKQIKSVEKIVLTTKKNEGKMSSHSDNLYNREYREKVTMTQPIPEEDQDLDYSREEQRHTRNLQDNLEQILDDENTKVQLKAYSVKAPSHKTTPNQFGSSVKKQQHEDFDLKEKVIVEEAIVQERGEEEAGNKANERNELMEEELAVDETTEKVERKEYSVYEDWRILETIEDLMERGEAKSLGSRNLWAKIIDPLTGARLLDGRRSSESMRDRYKRYLACLDEAGKTAIRDFCDTNTLAAMKKNHCTFKKVDGQKKFVGIAEQLNYNVDRLSRKTPYGTKPKPKSPDAKKNRSKSKRKSTEEAEQTKAYENFEEETKEELEDQTRIERMLESNNLEDDIEEVTQTETKVVKVTGRDVDRQVVVTRDVETVMKKKPEAVATKNKSTGFSMTSTNIPVRDKPVQTIHRTFEDSGAKRRDSWQDENVQGLRLNQRVGENYQPVVPQARGNKKRKTDEISTSVNFSDVVRREMKKVKQNEELEQVCLPVNNVFQSKKPFSKATSEMDNLMIYVDLREGHRQFVKHEEEEEEGEDEIEDKLKELAGLYKADFSHVIAAFSKVSCDFGDLEEYLQTKDSRMLWTDTEDADLLNDDKIALKYLKLLKGEEKVKKRKEYLAAIIE